MQSETRPLAGKAVLIVEDEYLIALEVQRMAEEAGAAEVSLANSVAEVRMLLADGPPIDAAVLDLKLGAEDATPLIAEFAARRIPLLVTTAFSVADLQGVIVLAKPYHDAQFVDAVRRLVQA